MNSSGLPHDQTSDEAFLDDAFDRIIRLLEDGHEPQADQLLDGRDDLRSRLEELIRLARDISPAANESLPQITGFQILQKLGHGGMGAVYLARQESLGGRPVALKVLPASATLSSRARERFLSEARAIARLRHPHVVAIHAVLHEHGLYAYAMEWIEGGTLAERIPQSRDRAAMTSDRIDAVPNVCRVGIAIARALSAVHAAGLLHRDVKPSNILLRRDGTPLLSDFGLAREAHSSLTLTQAGRFVGTVSYAAPEQLRGESTDVRSDVYALGVTLYHALAGRLPFDAREPHDMLRRIESGLAPPLRKLNPRVPRDLETIVATAMDPDPARRYQAANDLADDLDRLLALQPIRARRAGVAARALKFARRNRGAAIGTLLGGTLSLTLAATAVTYTFLVPRWVAEHVRAARVALLDPGQANDIVSTMYWGRVNSYSAERLDARKCVFDKALASYDAALRWAPYDEHIRSERNIVIAARENARFATARPILSALSLRDLGLYSFLTQDYSNALSAWTRWEQTRDTLSQPDPLIDAAFGVLYLFDDQAPRAYPRLQQAVIAFPNVGFLLEYLADAAAKCGDVERAARWLRDAEQLPQSDEFGAQLRIKAAILARQGFDDDAEAIFQRLPVGLPAGLEYARFLAVRGRLREATALLAVSVRTMSAQPVAREFTAIADRWWASLSRRERLRSIRAALDEPAGRSGSLVDILRAYSKCRPRNHAAPSNALSNNVSAALGMPFYLFWSTLTGLYSSPSLQNCSLSELAERMEVGNMALWTQVSSYSQVLKDARCLAWRLPWLGCMTRRVEACWIAATTTMRRRRHGAAAALVFAAMAAGHASAQVVNLIDTEFANADWTASIDTGGVPSASFVAAQATTGGNPQSWRSITHDWTGPGGFRVLHWRAGATYDPSQRGEIDSIDTSLDAIVISSGLGVGYGIALIQNGIPYIEYNVALLPQWTTLAHTSLHAEDFFDSENSHPDFSQQGSIIQFGFFSSNSVADDQHIDTFSGVDNWSVVLHCKCTTPPCFQGLGDLPGGAVESSATAVSADGTAVVGYSKSASSGANPEAFRWRANTGMVALGDLPGGAYYSLANDVSRDGAVVVGDSYSGSGTYNPPFEGFKWTEVDGMTSLGDAPGADYYSRAQAVSDDSAVIAGQTIVGPSCTAGSGPPARWNNGTGPAPLSGSEGYYYGTSWGMSGSGNILVGNVVLLNCPSSDVSHAFRWSEAGGFQDLGDLPGGVESAVLTRANIDGAIAVGYGSSANGREAARWDQPGGLSGLGDFAGGDFDSVANDISADGNLIVGFGTSAVGREAAMWDANRTMRRAAEILSENQVSVPAGWTLRTASGVTVDGNVVTICGEGTNAQGNTEAWIARYHLPCPGHDGDMNTDSSTDGRDIFRFTQAVLAASTAYADTCPGDFDNTGVVGAGDVPGFVSALLH